MPSSQLTFLPSMDAPLASLQNIEGMLAEANDASLEHGVATASIFEGFRLESRLSCGRDGIAYEAVEVRSGRRVEFRQLAVEYRSPEAWERLRVHLARLSLAHDPAVRRVLEFGNQAAPFLVGEPAASLSWRTWRGSVHYRPAVEFEVMRTVCRALIEAKRFGSHCVGKLAEKIGIVDSHPQLDLLGLDFVGESASPVANDGPNATLEGEVFACFVDECLAFSRTAGFLASLAPRQSGQLRHLIAAAKQGDGDEMPTLEDFQKCFEGMAALLPSPLVEANSANGTLEICESSQPVVDGGTCEVGPITPPELELLKPNGKPAGPSLRTDLPFLDELRVGDLLGRYRIEAKLGEGGMGTVFRAQDTTDRGIVAIKVLNRAAQLKTQSLHRFRKEARVLASLKNPFITNLIEVNEERGRNYIVLEYVDGIDLHKILKKLGPIPAEVALGIVADVARGLLDAHRRDMIHRDLKPENILIAHGERWLADGFDPAVNRARLTDFGIARQIDQSQSLAVTQAGGLLGSPIYMSPEQCRGSNVGPQADVYSLGITLFELLTGRPPFQADETLKLIGMHCYDPAPLVQRVDARISDRVGAIVAKCLAKDPAERYADAGHLLEAIELELRGEASSVQLHPLLPATADGAVSTNEMIWDFASSPEQLWPYVSNTDRLNRAMGLPAVAYVTERDGAGRLRRYATVKMGGIAVRWEEHPFEWIEGRRMSVLREFDGGLFQWFSSTVELERLPEGGTRLKHTVRMAGRNWLGRVVAKRETGDKCRRTLDAIYTRIDRVLRSETRTASHQDPFAAVKTPKASIIRRIDERLKAMEERDVSADMIGKLRDYVLHASAQDLAKIRPLVLAERLCTDVRETLDACLIAADAGLFQLEWDILCPTCRVSADTKASLKELTSHSTCEACAIDFQSDLANALELVFRVHRDILDTDVGKFCIGGPAHTPHVVAQVRCEPGERIELPLTLQVGNYLLRGPNWSANMPLEVLSSGAPTRVDLDIRTAQVGRAVSTFRAGQQLLVLTNHTDLPQILRLERTIPREHVVTAAQAMALPGFRALFPGEVLEPGRLISSENVTLLSTRIANIDESYAKRGDRESFGLIRPQLELIQAHVERRRGDVVKIVGEGILAVFGAVEDAVCAAFEIRNEIIADERMRGLAIVIGVHRGPAIVTTINSRLDYFGAVSRQIQALPELIERGVVLTETVYTDPIVNDFLRTQTPATMRVADLPGRPQQLLQIY